MSGLPPKPTEAELAILRVLWQRGPSTVREVWERLSPRQRTGYTTALKIMHTTANTDPNNMIALWENYIIYTLTNHFNAIQ